MQSTRNVLIVHQGAELYGSDRMVIQLLSALHQTSTFSISFHLPNNGPLVDHIKAYCANLIIHPISVLRLSLLKTVRWLNIKRFLSNLAFAQRQINSHDIIIVNTCVILSYLMLLPFCKKKKYIYIHEIPTGFTKFAFNIMLWLSGANLICNSQATAKTYPFIKNSKKTIVYNSTPETSCENKPTGETLNLLLIGRLSPRKGHHVLIKSLDYLTDDQQKSVSIRFAGSSYNDNNAYQNDLNTLIHSINPQTQIEFFPFSNDIQQHYAWSDIFIMPSIKPESFGLVALEAMQCSKAVIASDTGALPEIVQHNQTGFITKTNNPLDLSIAIKSYLAQPELIKVHGIAGKLRASQLFSLQNYNKNIVEVISA